MYRYKRILVAVNLQEQDPATLRYAALISRMAKPQKIHFVHVAPEFDLPESFLREYPDLIPPVDELLQERVKEQVAKYFDGYEGAEKIVEVMQGNLLLG